MPEIFSKKPVVFNSSVIAEYKLNPCRLFPTALWKNSSYCTRIQMCCKNSNLEEVVLYNENELFTYFNNKRQMSPSILQEIKKSSLVLLHDDYYSNEIENEFHDIQSYFRLSYSATKSNIVSNTSNYSIVDALFPHDAAEIAAFIKLCYGYFTPSVEDIVSWMERVVFDARLWVWIKEKNTNKPVGLGIAERDIEIPEVSLEWIQVHPNYRGQGIASCVIQELIARSMATGIDIITVSGEVENTTQPEKVYRKNGFTGSDIWWCLKKRKE